MKYGLESTLDWAQPWSQPSLKFNYGLKSTLDSTQPCIEVNFTLKKTLDWSQPFLKVNYGLKSTFLKIQRYIKVKYVLNPTLDWSQPWIKVIIINIINGLMSTIGFKWPWIEFSHALKTTFDLIQLWLK